jgi:hypothetical protein
MAEFTDRVSYDDSLVGQKFGERVIVSNEVRYKKYNTNRHVLCRCSCKHATETWVSLSSLKTKSRCKKCSYELSSKKKSILIDRELLERELNNGKTIREISFDLKCHYNTVRKNVLKLNIKNPNSLRKLDDLTDQRFGRLIVLERYIKENDEHTFWKCMCACEKKSIINVRAEHLKTGITKSCGCYSKDINSKGYQEINGSYWNSIKRNAKKRKIEFNIGIEYAWNLFLEQDRKCALTNLQLNFCKHNDLPEQTASLDRIDSNGSYTIGNVQWVHKVINLMKTSLSNNDFILMSALVFVNNQELIHETQKRSAIT